MKKILAYFLLVFTLFSEQNYNLSVSNWNLSDKNKINAFTMGSSLEFQLRERVSYFGDVGSVYLSGRDLYNSSHKESIKNTYYFDWGIYVEMGLKYRKNIKKHFNPYIFSSFRGTYFLSRFLKLSNIPDLKDELLSYKLGAGIDFNDLWFAEYNFEIINNYKSDYSKSDKIYVNNLKFGMRAY